MIGLLLRGASWLRRLLLGVSADEIRYTFQDVRRELRDARREIQGELVALRRDLEALAAPVAGLRDAGKRAPPARRRAVAPAPAKSSAAAGRAVSRAPRRAPAGRRPRRRR